MTEDRLQTLEEVQCKILAILESYLRLYDRQSQQLHDLQQQLQNTHRLVHKLYVIPYPGTSVAHEEEQPPLLHYRCR